MEKQTFEIPKGCSKVTVEQIGNTLVTTFDVESEFKIGDVCVDESSKSPIIFIFGGYDGKYTKRYADVWGDGSGCFISPIAESYGEEMDFRHATESEKQVIFDALAKIGKMWDAEKLEITNLKYVPKVGDCVKVYQSEKIYNIGRVSHVAGDLIYFRPPCILSGKVWLEKKCAQNAEWFTFEQLTPEELQAEFNKLGYEYNFETHEATKIKWKPKEGEIYYYVSTGCKVIKAKNNNYYGDIEIIKIGNCYRTPEDSEKRRQHYLNFKD